MLRNLSALLLAFCSIPVLCSPSLAGSNNEKSKQAFSAREKALALPKAIAGVCAGLTVGVPVKIAKDIRHETYRMAGTSRGDMGNQFGLVENVFVAGTSIPYGLVSGLITGTIRGAERAVIYGSRTPFCKESLGLKEPERYRIESQAFCSWVADGFDEY